MNHSPQNSPEIEYLGLMSDKHKAIDIHYTYDFAHPTTGLIMPHAVSSVTDPAALISDDNQDISYTGFNSIRERLSQIMQ